MNYVLRMAAAIVAATSAWAAVAGILLLLPHQFAVVTMFAGLLLFSLGAKLHWRYPTIIGGVLMFGGVFAAALLGAFG